MAATLLARYSTTQRLCGSCSGQLRPAEVMLVEVMLVVMLVLLMVVMLVMVARVSMSMVCPTAW